MQGSSVFVPDFDFVEVWGTGSVLSSRTSSRTRYASWSIGSERPVTATNHGYPRRRRPLQFGVTLVLLASLLLLAMAAITRYTVGEPVVVLPSFLAKALHHPAPQLPPGMTYDFSVLNPDTKQPIAALPEVGSVELRLAVTNDSALPMSMRFASGRQCEFIIRRVFYYVDGLFALPLEVWRSSYFHVIPRKPTVLLLQPGETRVYTALFDLTALNARQVPPGGYRVIAAFGDWQTSQAIDKPL